MMKPTREQKVVGVRLSVEAQQMLDTLKTMYGLRSTTALLETLIRQRHMQLTNEKSNVLDKSSARTARQVEADRPNVSIPFDGDEDEADAPRVYEKYN